MLDIVQVRKPDEEGVKEGLFVQWEGLACEDLEEIAKVVAAAVSAMRLGQDVGGKGRRRRRRILSADQHLVHETGREGVIGA